MNRTDQLLKSLPSWTAEELIHEIIVVDWSSDEPIKQSVLSAGGDKTRVIRVEGERSWHLTRAFNAGLQYVATDQVLKLDADYFLRPKFFDRNTLAPQAFITGDWRATRPGQSGLNGLLWAWTEDLLAVGGWDERIAGYGWDDSDLTERLTAVGLLRETVTSGTVIHLHHRNSTRTKNQSVHFPLPPKLHTQLNRIRTHAEPPWLGSTRAASNTNTFYGPISHETDLDRWVNARVKARDDVRPVFSWLRQKRQLLISPMIVRARVALPALLRQKVRKKVIVLQVKHGLGNRFRAMASALSVAAAENARLIVAWVPDEHCGAELLDLINYRGQVISSEAELATYVKDRRVAVIDLMDSGSAKKTRGPLRFRRRLTYIRSSKKLSHPSVKVSVMSRTIRSWSPSDSVTGLLRQIDVTPDLGVHVRQGNYRGALTPSFEKETGNWSQDSERKIRFSRSTTRADRFYETLRGAVDAGSRRSLLRVYVCADSDEAAKKIHHFLATEGVEKVNLGADGEDRSREGVMRAMADAIVLSRATHFIGARYSAFTDLVVALRGDTASHTLVGQDAAAEMRVTRDNSGHTPLSVDGPLKNAQLKSLPEPNAKSSFEVRLSRRRLYIDAQHGLGNRLRAIGSAAAIAEVAERELVIVWNPDAHCEARFPDLFDYSGPVESEPIELGASRLNRYDFTSTQSSEKPRSIDLSTERDIYVRSASVLESPHSHWETENRFIRALTPVEQVQDLVGKVSSPYDASVHVRMVGGRDYEQLPYESASNWSESQHEQIDHRRKASHFSHFIERLRDLMASGRVNSAFVAADLPDTYVEFHSAFPGKIYSLERSDFDRSVAQIRFALADAILLSRAPLLLGSSWSSFSELALRLSKDDLRFELSGRDF